MNIVGQSLNALHYCAMHNNIEVAKLLIFADAKLDLQEPYGKKTALGMAIRYEFDELA